MYEWNIQCRKFQRAMTNSGIWGCALTGFGEETGSSLNVPTRDLLAVKRKSSHISLWQSGNTEMLVNKKYRTHVHRLPPTKVTTEFGVAFVRFLSVCVVPVLPGFSIPLHSRNPLRLPSLSPKVSPFPPLPRPWILPGYIRFVMECFVMLGSCADRARVYRGSEFIPYRLCRSFLVSKYIASWLRHASIFVVPKFSSPYSRTDTWLFIVSECATTVYWYFS